MPGESFPRAVIAELTGIGFYAYELYQFFHHPWLVGSYDELVIRYLQFLILTLALPLIYLCRLAELFVGGNSIHHFLSGHNSSDHGSTFFQIKFFYYTALVGLVLLRVIKWLW